LRGGYEEERYITSLEEMKVVTYGNGDKYTGNLDNDIRSGKGTHILITRTLHLLQW